MAVHPLSCTAFEGHRRIASGALPYVALAVREVLARGEQAAGSWSSTTSPAGRSNSICAARPTRSSRG